MFLLFQEGMFRFHVSCQGCTSHFDCRSSLRSQGTPVFSFLNSLKNIHEEKMTQLTVSTLFPTDVCEYICVCVYNIRSISVNTHLQIYVYVPCNYIYIYHMYMSSVFKKTGLTKLPSCVLYSYVYTFTSWFCFTNMFTRPQLILNFTAVTTTQGISPTNYCMISQ